MNSKRQASRNASWHQRAISALMAVVLVVGLMPLPAFAGDATDYAAAGSDALQSAQPEQQEGAQLEVTSEDVTLEAAGSLTYSSNNLNFYLYSGYNGNGEAGALRSYTIKNTGSVKVTGIKLANFSAKKTATIEYDENDNPITVQNTVPYVLTDEYGSVRYDSNYLEDWSYWADDEKFDLSPGESKKLYFTVASPFRAGYTLKTGTNLTDTVQIKSDNTAAKTVNLHCEVYDPGGSYAKFGTTLSNGSVSGAAAINFGTVAAGTEVFDEQGNYNKYQMFYIQNAATAKDSKRGGLPESRCH